MVESKFGSLAYQRNEPSKFADARRMGVERIAHDDVVHEGLDGTSNQVVPPGMYTTAGWPVVPNEAVPRVALPASEVDGVLDRGGIVRHPIADGTEFRILLRSRYTVQLAPLVMNGLMPLCLTFSYQYSLGARRA